jgi:hypothetical protein
MINVITFYTLV